MKLTNRKVLELNALLKEGSYRIADFKTAYALNKSADIVRGEAEIITQSLRGLQESFSTKDADGSVIYDKIPKAELHGEKIIEGFDTVARIKDAKAYNLAYNKALDETAEVNIHVRKFDKIDDALSAFGDNNRALLLELTGTVINIKELE